MRNLMIPNKYLGHCGVIIWFLRLITFGTVNQKMNEKVLRWRIVLACDSAISLAFLFLAFAVASVLNLSLIAAFGLGQASICTVPILRPEV